MILLISWILNAIPESIQYKICKILGLLLYHLYPQKRRIILHNLFNVFPQKTSIWRKSIAKINCQRWVETAWTFAISSHWTRQMIKQHMTISHSLKTWLQTMEKNPHPCIVLTPHLNLMETLTWLQAVHPIKNVEIGIMYRPLRNAYFDHWIQKSRERFNLKLISRKRGIAPLEQILARNGIVGILFDQSAGNTGILTTFFGKLASTTDLPGRLAEKFQAEVVAIYLKRTGFIKGEIHIEKIMDSGPKKSLATTLTAQSWFENKLSDEASIYENWLWMHKRWKTQTEPSKRFCIYQKRNALTETMAFYHWEQLPKKTRVWIRMPNWLGDCVMTYPVVRALREARPDFDIHLICQKPWVTWMEKNFPVDSVHPLPQKRSLAYFKTFLHLRAQYPEIWINFTNSIRSDLESFCSGATQRFGVCKKGYRPLLTHVWKPTAFHCHQTELWYQYLQHFGLNRLLSRTPLAIHARPATEALTFACFCGSANTPNKRWPIGYWYLLISDLLHTYPNAKCLLLGSKNDAIICTQIAQKIAPHAIKNLAGKTNLIQLEQILQNTHFVVANDSGGMHLSNLLGVPTVGLFAKTSPLWGGPFFEAPKCILQGHTHAMESLEPQLVYKNIVQWWNKVTRPIDNEQNA